jgi:hypothetical protein
VIRVDGIGLIIQQRDIQLLLGLFESRLATSHHLRLLHFEGRVEATKVRLRKLKKVGLIEARDREVDEPAVYQLTKQGFEVLKANVSLDHYPLKDWHRLQRRLQVSDLTITHELKVVGVKAAIGAALSRMQGLRAISFSTWPGLHKFCVRGRTGPMREVKPDGYFHACEKLIEGGLKDHHFFLEVDRSTESRPIVLKKTQDYLTYYRTGGFAANQGAGPDRYKEVPFRVLIVCKSIPRRDNLAKRMVEGKPTIRGLVWLTTAPELEADPLGEIWVTPGMYKPWPKPDIEPSPDTFQKLALFKSSGALPQN